MQISRRTLLLIAPGALVSLGFSPLALAGDISSLPSWQGEHTRRITADEAAALSAALRDFFGEAQAQLTPGEETLLFDQFAAADYGFIMDEYQLPSGQLILDRYNASTGIDTVVVTDGSSSSPTILATALLTHLCPTDGVDENLKTASGVKYQEHFRCQLDYSLAIFYGRGSTPDLELNADLTKWAKASIKTRGSWARLDRKRLLKRFVRVLS